MRLRPSALFALVLILAVGSVATSAAGDVGQVHRAAAPAGEIHVDAREEYFYPSTVTVRRGGTVVWDWTGLESHTATDESGMGLFDSGLAHPGDPSFPFVFDAAGSYPYVCTLHEGMDGTVHVPIRANRAEGGITVTWSTQAPPAGFVLDVQARRGDHRWRSWLEGATDASGLYPAERGTYRFRARLRLSSTGASAGWSEPASITL